MKKTFLILTFLLSQLSVSASMIVFEDQFTTDSLGSTWTVGWTVGTTSAVGHITGDYFNSSINTSGNSDHSGVHFDAGGNEIAATGDGYLALGTGNRPPVNSIETTLSVTAGTTYDIYFRHAGAPNTNPQRVTATMTLGGDSSSTGIIDATNNVWNTASFSFTPAASGNATLRFDDTGSSSSSNDLLLDSVLVSAIPEPGSMLMALTGGLLLLHLRRLRRK